VEEKMEKVRDYKELEIWKKGIELMKIKYKTFLPRLLKLLFFIGFYLLIAFLLANNKVEAIGLCTCISATNEGCTNVCPDLPAPSGLTWGSVSNPETQLQPTWGSVSGASYYNLTASTTTFNNITNTYYLHTGLCPGTNYSYQVQACKSGCTLCNGYNCSAQDPYDGTCTSNQTACGPNSNSWSNTTAFNAPSGLNATPYSSSQCNLSWTDNSSAETNYLVERGNSSCSGFSQIASLSANTTYYNNSGLSGGTTYCYQVRAYHSTCGTYSSYSNTVTCTTLSAYIDCGLRLYDGTAIVTIACEPLGTLTSPLRIYKGVNTYGIVLVSTTSANASKMRIQTNSGLKALMKQ